MPLPSERRRLNDDQRVATLMDAPDQGYDYPDGADLRPGSEFHDDLLEELLSLARTSASAMAPRHPDMLKMEETMRAFIPLDDKERLAQSKDRRKPVSIVVPVTYGLYDALATQVFASYAATRELHFYRGHGPEDTVGAMLGEKLIGLQTSYFNELATISTQLRDEMTYGFGVVTPVWTREVGFEAETEPTTFTDPITGEVIPDPTAQPKTRWVERVAFEGNRVYNIDPYCYLPDPNVPIHQPQDGEFVGWVTANQSRASMLAREAVDSQTYFNCRYLKYLPKGVGRTSLFETTRRTPSGVVNPSTQERLEPLDVLYLYVKLIPYEWALGSSELPEVWMFGVAADKIIVSARPLGLAHNKFPVAVVAADTDGYDTCPLGRLETSYGLQQAVNYLWNSKMRFTKKALLGEFLAREEFVNMGDLVNPAEGRIIRVSRLAMNVPLDSVVSQLKAVDPNPSALQEIMSLNAWMQQATGATNTVVGVAETQGERKSATEIRGARTSSLGRIDRYVQLRNAQGMNDLSRLMFSQTAQLLSGPMYVEAVGRWEDELRMEFNLQGRDPWIKVDPRQLKVGIDVVPGDAVNTGQEYFQDWVTLYGMIIQNPMLLQSIDMVRVFKHIARLGGAKNISDFMLPGGPATAQGMVMPMDQLQSQIQAGNLVPATQEASYAPNRL